MHFSLILSLHTGIVGGNLEIISDAANADGITESVIKYIYMKAALRVTIIISPFYVKKKTFVIYKETQRSLQFTFIVINNLINLLICNQIKF